MAAADTAASISRSVSCSWRAFLACLTTLSAPKAVVPMDRYVPDLDFLKPLAFVSALDSQRRSLLEQRVPPLFHEGGLDGGADLVQPVVLHARGR